MPLELRTEFFEGELCTVCAMMLPIGVLTVLIVLEAGVHATISGWSSR